jgi:surface antigen
MIEDNCLMAASSPLLIESDVLATMSQDDVESAREIVEYIVGSGDSLWSIASKFNVSVDTLVWANDIESQIISPGQKLIILPVTGVMHLVEEGDTVSKIAQNYSAEERDVVSFNDLEDGRDLFAGEIIIVPDGRMPSNSRLGVASAAFTGLSTNNFYGQSHAFPYGQCTWWVAQKRSIPSWGNAVDWLPNARAAGYSTCYGRYCVPQVGAVVSLQGHRIYGHVAYVERVIGDKVVFSEMNYIGLGKMNYRTLRIGDPLIRGYIY